MSGSMYVWTHWTAEKHLSYAQCTSIFLPHSAYPTSYTPHRIPHSVYPSTHTHSLWILICVWLVRRSNVWPPLFAGSFSVTQGAPCGGGPAVHPILYRYLTRRVHLSSDGQYPIAHTTHTYNLNIIRLYNCNVKSNVLLSNTETFFVVLRWWHSFLILLFDKFGIIWLHFYPAANAWDEVRHHQVPRGQAADPEEDRLWAISWPQCHTQEDGHYKKVVRPEEETPGSDHWDTEQNLPRYNAYMTLVSFSNTL